MNLHRSNHTHTHTRARAHARTHARTHTHTHKQTKLLSRDVTVTADIIPRYYLTYMSKSAVYVKQNSKKMFRQVRTICTMYIK